MVRSTGAQRRTLRGAVAAALVAALASAGCGGGDFANEPRAPAPITVSAVITPSGVTMSPRRFGSGPIELLASNQTQTSQHLQLRSRRAAGGGRALVQTTGPINPGGTATLNADVDAGTYVVSVRAAAIAPAQVVVTKARGSAQDRLLQP
ncbi:MAG: hypothetical protein QOJ89_168 [bacterium]|jgi:hypothetical protein